MGGRCGSGLALHSLDTPLKKAFVALNVIEMFLKGKEYFCLSTDNIKLLMALVHICCIHNRSTNQNVTAIVISHYSYNVNSHIPFLSMGPSKMRRATQSQGHETPLLPYLHLSCKSKSIVCDTILAPS